MSQLLISVVLAAACAFIVWRAISQAPSRTRRAYRLWAVPFFGGFALIVLCAAYNSARPSGWPALTTLPVVAAAAFWLGILFIPLHLLAGWLGWPKVLIPQAFQGSPSWFTLYRLARQRKREGLPPTDHLVQIYEVNLDEGTDEAKQFYAARCEECTWMEQAETADPVAEMRSAAARHTTKVGAEVVAQHF